MHIWYAYIIAINCKNILFIIESSWQKYLTSFIFILETAHELRSYTFEIDTQLL